MTPLDLVAVVIVCVSCMTSVWVIAERWFVHRDRAVAQLVKDTEIMITESVALVSQTADDAAERLDAHVAERAEALTRIEAQVKALLDAEQARAWERRPR